MQFETITFFLYLTDGKNDKIWWYPLLGKLQSEWKLSHCRWHFGVTSLENNSDSLQILKEDITQKFPF